MAWRQVSLASGVAAVVACAPPALAAAALSPSPLPLPGSSFQGADGNQANEGGFIDWEALETEGRVVHNDDPNEQDTTFAGGTKEGDPAHWSFETTPGGVTPGKANILDAWSAVDQPAGRTFLYLAFARDASAGDTFLTFELNQSGRTWVNDNKVRVPCRRDGDILVSYEISGNSADVFLRRWRTDVTDPAAGCDRTGTIVPFTTVRATCRRRERSTPARSPTTSEDSGADIQFLRFGEAALDLDALLGAAFEDGCYAFGSIWMHSRSSTPTRRRCRTTWRPSRSTCGRARPRARSSSTSTRTACTTRTNRDPRLPDLRRLQRQRASSTPGSRHGQRQQRPLRAQRHPRPSYRLRERLLPTRRRATNDWRCSFPNASTDGGFGSGPGLPCGWGPIDSRHEPNATGQGLRQLVPGAAHGEQGARASERPGPLRPVRQRQAGIRDAQDGSSVTLHVPPGSYTASEQAVPPTDPSQYTSTRVLQEALRAGAGARRHRLRTSRSPPAAGPRAGSSTCGPAIPRSRSTRAAPPSRRRVTAGLHAAGHQPGQRPVPRGPGPRERPGVRRRARAQRQVGRLGPRRLARHARSRRRLDLPVLAQDRRARGGLRAADRAQHRHGERHGRRGDRRGQQQDPHDADLPRQAAPRPARDPRSRRCRRTRPTRRCRPSHRPEPARRPWCRVSRTFPAWSFPPGPRPPRAGGPAWPARATRGSDAASPGSRGSRCAGQHQPREGHRRRPPRAAPSRQAAGAQADDQAPGRLAPGPHGWSPACSSGSARARAR